MSHTGHERVSSVTHWTGNGALRYTLGIIGCAMTHTVQQTVCTGEGACRYDTYLAREGVFRGALGRKRCGASHTGQARALDVTHGAGEGA